jgi:hypothetical protein
MSGLKQQIRAGEISPDDAIKSVMEKGTPSQNFLNWANGTGRKRYAEARKKASNKSNE